MANIEFRKSKNLKENKKAFQVLVELDDITITILPAGQVVGFNSVSIKDEEGGRYYGLSEIEKFAAVRRKAAEIEKLLANNGRELRELIKNKQVPN